MKLTKVIYQFGNNQQFDYYILDRKENAIEKDIVENSLAYKLGGRGKVKISNYGQIIFGGFDVLLEKRKKGTDVFCGYSLATVDEISKIK